MIVTFDSKELQIYIRKAKILIGNIVSNLTS